MPTRNRMTDIAGLVAWVAVTFMASYVGARASIAASSFYAELTQPAWAPPAWLFGPVWTTLFSMMAVAAWLVWREGGFATQRNALLLFLAQLVLNVLWSWLFFAWKQGAWAFIEVLALWTAILTTTVLFWRARPVAGLLLVPYLLWVSFAALLNYALWRGNPALL